MPAAATTFSLEAPLPPPAWGEPSQALRRLRDARVQRFAFFCIGAVLATGSGTALAYGASVGSGLTLAAGLVLLARAGHLWWQRPFLRLDARGLTFRLRPTGRQHAVRWSALTRLDTELRGVYLHREEAPAMHLLFDRLSGDAAHRLTTHLADTARVHGIPVHST